MRSRTPPSTSTRSRRDAPGEDDRGLARTALDRGRRVGRHAGLGLLEPDARGADGDRDRHAPAGHDRDPRLDGGAAPVPVYRWPRSGRARSSGTPSARTSRRSTTRSARHPTRPSRSSTSPRGSRGRRRSRSTRSTSRRRWETAGPRSTTTTLGQEMISIMLDYHGATGAAAAAVGMGWRPGGRRARARRRLRGRMAAGVGYAGRCDRVRRRPTTASSGRSGSRPASPTLSDDEVLVVHASTDELLRRAVDAADG